MLRSSTSWALAFVALGGFCSPAAAEEALDSERDRTLYSLGAYIGLSMKPYELSASELEVFYQGLRDQVTGAHARFRARVRARAETYPVRGRYASSPSLQLFTFRKRGSRIVHFF